MARSFAVNRLLVLGILGGLALLGCSRLETRVTAHDADREALSGLVFLVVPLKEAQAGVLEARTAEAISRQLEAHGLRRAPAAEQASALVLFEIAMTGVDQKIVTKTVQVPGSTQLVPSASAWATPNRIGPPQPMLGSNQCLVTIPPAIRQELALETVYRSAFTLRILKGAGRDGERLYEVTVQGRSDRGRLEALAPKLVEAALKAFPQEDGKTVVREFTVEG
jgi:hypothetical protein